MDETRDRRIATVATAQHGVFTTAHADEAGLTRDQRDKRVRTGRWVLVHPGVYRIAGAPVSWRGMLLADCWASRRLSVASHRSAAELWGLPGGQTDIIEITCDRWKRARPPGLVVHETSLLLPDDTTEVDGIPVTTLDQTLLGLAAVASPAVVEMALDRALRLGAGSRPRSSSTRSVTTVGSSPASTRRTPNCALPSSTTATSTTPGSSRSYATTTDATTSRGSTGGP